MPRCKAPKDIWTMCLICHIAFLARSVDAPLCSDCIKEKLELTKYDKNKHNE